MPDTYRIDDMPDEGESTEITRVCRECGTDILVTLYGDGAFETTPDANYFGEIRLPAPGATVIGETITEDPWFDRYYETTWSEYVTEEHWRCESHIPSIDEIDGDIPEAI